MTSSASATPASKPLPAQSRELFGHPTGLFALFFAEMWERFSYYGMRSLLVFYMVKGFLGYNDSRAYAVYGAYTAMVYLTPYFGGILADQVLGARRAVVLGGLLMSAGHLLMTIETQGAFFGALALLIVGNGFFKPNISTIVGSLYPPQSGRRDAGFTIFYMGINLGAAMSPIVCGYIGETYGWHWGFGLATIGMLIGVAVFAAPTRLTQVLILGGAVATSVAMPFFQDSVIQLLVRLFLAVALTSAGVIAFTALGRGGLPDEAGRPRNPELARKAALWVYGGSLLAVGLFGLMFFEVSIAGVVLGLTGVVALGYLFYEAFFRCTPVERDRLIVVVVMAFFTMLFWAFFEQAGSSVNNFTDRNVDRAFESATIGEADVGKVLAFRVSPAVVGDEALDALPLLSQEQLGFENGSAEMKGHIAAALRVIEAEKAEVKGEEVDAEEVEGLVKQVMEEPRLTMTGLVALRSVLGKAEVGTATVGWQVVESNVGMGLADGRVPASEFQAANPIYILLFGLVFTALWTWLGARNLDPSAPIKFALGLAQLGLGFGAIWYGAQMADDRGMVAMTWLLLGYLLHTTGELCLSPVGLSMVTKLSPSRMVSSVMGAWFLSNAFSNYLAAIIATFTGGEHGDGEGLAIIPPPQETVNLYGDVFGTIAIAALVAAVVLAALSPLLKRAMHPDQPDT